MMGMKRNLKYKPADKQIPSQQFFIITKAFISDPQEAYFHLFRIFMLPKTSLIVYACPHQTRVCPSVREAYGDVGSSHWGHGLCPGEAEPNDKLLFWCDRFKHMRLQRIVTACVCSWWEEAEDLQGWLKSLPRC